MSRQKKMPDPKFGRPTPFEMPKRRQPLKRETVRARWTAVVRQIAQRIEAHRAYQELMSMSDCRLKAIGITRGDIPARVFGLQSKVPSVESAEAPLSAVEAALLQALKERRLVPANQNTLKQRRAS
jgi:uncharacterized protein YjiS (DUF1127 family)